MDDARFVRGLRGPRDLPRMMRRTLRDRQLAVARAPRQVRALDVRHRDVLDAVDLAEVVNADDVLVRDLPREQQLLLEAALDLVRRVAVLRDLRADDLQRDGDVEFGVPRLIDGAHAADAEQSKDV